jgi:hypothetical protein
MTNDCLPSIGSDNGQAGSSASRICTEKRASSDPWIAGEKPTWSQKLTAHPHVHCVVPAGGLSADHTRWIKPRYDFFLPIKVLSQLMTLSLDEFLRRFLLHLLPEGFVRIRNFGFLADRKRATTLPLSFQLLGGAPQTEQEASTAGPSDLWSCPKCGGPMMVVERLTASEIQLRSPPLVTAAA